MEGIIAYALSKKYTQKSLDGLGALKGAPCVIKETKIVDGGIEITFEWTGISGATETQTILVKNGEDGEQGNGIVKVEKIKSVDLVDTYRMTFTDGSIFDYEIINGDSSLVGASTWNEVKDKPFETIGADFTVVDNELKLADVVSIKIIRTDLNGEVQSTIFTDYTKIDKIQRRISEESDIMTVTLIKAHDSTQE